MAFLSKSHRNQWTTRERKFIFSFAVESLEHSRFANACFPKHRQITKFLRRNSSAFEFSLHIHTDDIFRLKMPIQVNLNYYQ